MDVELRHLRYFVAVAEELHFGRAAARLHMAQPPLSQAVRQLEALVGCQLLARTSRSVRLTPAGAAFLGRARRTLRNVSDDVLEARSIGRGEAGLLNVGFVGSAMLTVLPEVFRRHLHGHAGVRLQLHESYTSRVVEGLLDASLDAGVVRDGDPVEGLVSTLLLTEPFVALVPAGHHLAHLDELPLGALAGEPFVSAPRSTGARAYDKALNLCEEHGFRPVVAHEASHWLTIARLIGVGLGVSIAPACVESIITPEVRCVALEGVSMRSELTLVHRAGEDRPMVHAFERGALAAAGAGAPRAAGSQQQLSSAPPSSAS